MPRQICLIIGGDCMDFAIIKDQQMERITIRQQAQQRLRLTHVFAQLPEAMGRIFAGCFDFND